MSTLVVATNNNMYATNFNISYLVSPNNYIIQTPIIDISNKIKHISRFAF